MKKLLILAIATVFSQQVAAQDPVLLDTNWYIDHLILDGVTHESPIGGIGIFNPNIEFEETIAFAVIDPDSDSFFANITYDPVDPEFTFTEPAITLPGCQAYCEFAQLYFDLLAGDFISVDFSYEIVSNGDGTLKLTLTRADGNIAVFNDFPPLGIEDLPLQEVKIHPNPVANILNITLGDVVIDELAVYSISGAKVLTGRYDGSMNVSGLPQGIYFLKLTSENGTAIRKFIKK